jgi:hypothetical protein
MVRSTLSLRWEPVMARRHLLAVQIQHSGAHPMSGRSGAVGLTIMFIGVALACCGAAPALRFRLWRAQARLAHGSIVDNVPQPTGKWLVSWLPIVEFQADGEHIMSLVAGPARPQGWPLGGAVDVLYDPTDPHRVRLADTRFPVSSLLIAGLAIVAGFLAIVT